VRHVFTSARDARATAVELSLRLDEAAFGKPPSESDHVEPEDKPG
jgi:hypothetical protein